MDTAVIHSLTGVLVPLFGMAFVIGVVLVVMEYRHRRERLLHETVTRLAEKGLTLPKELFSTPSAPKSRLFGALTLIGLGVGLMIYFGAQGGDQWGIGAIPLAVGVAQLLAWKLERPKSGTSDSDSQG